MRVRFCFAFTLVELRGPMASHRILTTCTLSAAFRQVAISPFDMPRHHIEALFSFSILCTYLAHRTGWTDGDGMAMIPLDIFTIIELFQTGQRPLSSGDCVERGREAGESQWTAGKQPRR
jgi:hypothetical protein